MPSDLDRLKAALADRYEIEREIGSGGMATVYLATDLRHERQVALKVLRPDLAESLGPKRFLQEVRVTANLQHPHILPLFDSGSSDGFLFYVMPFIEGESLRERLAREGELPVPEAARILRDVVDALATAHRAGVVHRDIKPENVLISGRHALVADFGVAKAVTEATGRHLLTTMGVALGTPYYMAPEQAAADKNIDHRADIYSIGAMAYELLAGRPPFTGPNAQAVLTAQVTKKPEPVSEHRASVPPALEQLIMRCLEKKAADRWQAADEMLPYLEAAATPSGGITPTDMHPVTVATSPLARLPRWALPAGALGVAAVAGVWALGGGWGMGGEPAETSATASAAGAAASPDAGTELDSLQVVVLPFENRTGDPAADVWGELVAEEATRRLTQGASYLDVPTQGAVRSAGHTSGADPAAVARSFGARYVVSGRYSSLGDQVRFDADVSDALTGQLATAIDPVTVGRDAIQDAVEVVGERAAVAAAAYGRPNPGALTLRGLHPPSTFESLDRYISAGEAFCRNDYDQVLAELESLIESDPAFTAPRLMTLPTYGNGGRGTLSRDSLEALARAALPRMTRVERINYTWLTSDSEEERLSAAQEQDELRTWAMSSYAVAFSALRLNRLETAAEAVERVPYEDACYSQWPALWSMRVTAHHLVGNHDTELQHAREAVRRFPRDVARVGQLGAAAAAAGRLAVADSAVEMLVALPVDADGIVNQLVMVGHELAAHGHAGPAARVYARAYELAVQRAAGSPARANAAVWALAPAEALPVVEAAVAAAPDDAIVRGLLGITLARLGRTEEAMAAAERSFELNPAGRYPVVVAAVAEGPRSAVEAMRRTLDAGGIYFHVGNLFLHYMPPLVEIADDPTWRALVAAR